MLCQLSTIKTRLGFSIATYDPFLTNPIKDVSVRSDKEIQPLPSEQTLPRPPAPLANKQEGSMSVGADRAGVVRLILSYVGCRARGA